MTVWREGVWRKRVEEQEDGTKMGWIIRPVLADDCHAL